MLIDLHGKTNLSEGVSLTPQQVLKQARKAGLDGIAICETLNTARCGEVLALAEDFDDLNVFIGVEIPTERGILLGFAPQIDSFYLSEEWRWLAHRTTPSAQAVMELFDEQNGVVIAARPYDLEIPFNMGDYIFTFDRIDGVEVFNPRVGQLQNNFALEAATFMGVGTVGGSDPSNDASVIGQYATFFEDELKTQSQLVEAMREAEFWAVQIGQPDTPKSSSRAPSSKSGRSSKGGRRSKGGRSRGRRSKGRGSKNRR